MGRRTFVDDWRFPGRAWLFILILQTLNGSSGQIVGHVGSCGIVEGWNGGRPVVMFLLLVLLLVELVDLVEDTVPLLFQLERVPAGVLDILGQLDGFGRRLATIPRRRR